MGVPSGDGLALMRGEVSMLVGGTVGVANIVGIGAELFSAVGVFFLFCLLISA